jgi:hypothetical protein
VKREMLFALVGLTLVTVSSPACLSSSSPSNNNNGDGGSSSGGSSGGSSGSSSGSSSGGSSGSSSGSSGLTSVPLTPSGTGYVDDANLGIVGSWYAYGDCWGTDGAPPGDCESKGMHATNACSSITSPTPSAGADGGGATGFPPNAMGALCLTGTAAQVVGNPPDYSNMFGIGIGLDFNNMGGNKQPYDATSHKVVGFEFDISGLPAAPGTVRVEFPFPGTDTSGDSYSETATSGTTHMQIKFADANFGPSFTPPMGTTEPKFDPSMVESIQFHVVTVTSASIPVTNLCVSNLAALVSP